MSKTTTKTNAGLLIILAMLATTISGIGIDLYSPSLPAIATHFDIPASYAKITISTYLVGMGVGQLVFGTLSDSFGRRKIILFGLWLFILASTLAIINENIYILMLLRCIQGFGGGACSASSKALLSDKLEGHQFNVAIAYRTIAWGLGPILAPVIGGYLQHYFNWHACFLAYTFYAAFVFLIMFILLDETIEKTKALRIKPIVAAFKEVLSSVTFLGGVLSLGLCASLIYLFGILGTFIIQNSLGFSAIVFGHTALFVGAAYFMGTLSNRFLLSIISASTIIKSSLIIMIIAGLSSLFCAYELPNNLFSFTIPIIMIIFSAGLIFPNCMAKALSIFRHMGGIASAAMGCLFVLCAALISAIISVFPIHNQVSATWCYVIIIVLQLLVYWLMLADR